MTDEDDISRRLIEVNANADALSYQLSALVRYIVRGSISQDYYQSNRFNATETMKFLVKQLEATPKPIPCSNIIDTVVDDLVVSDFDDERREGLLRVAEEGARFLLELSSTDNAARGRQSKQRHSLEQAIRYYNELSRQPRNEY